MLNDFVISQTDGRPLYLQIMEQIKQKIAVGDWEQGQELPSIRQLAIDLMVSVITVKRAYFELEREGVILTQQGKASTVAASAELGRRICEQELQQHLAAAVRLAIKLGLTPEQLLSELMRASLVMPAEELEIEQ